MSWTTVTKYTLRKITNTKYNKKYNKGYELWQGQSQTSDRVHGTVCPHVEYCYT